MKRTARLLKLLFLGALMSSARGEGQADGANSAGSIFQAAALEPAPDSWILDQARLFDAAEMARLSERLEAFHTKFGMQIYIVAYSVLIGETVEYRTRLLRDKWLSDGRGIILGYERGSDRMSFSTTGDPLNALLRSDLERIFAAAYVSAAEQAGAAERVSAAADLLLTDLPGVLDRWQGSEAAAESETREFIAWALGLLILLAILGMVAAHLLRRADMQVSKSYTFPHIKVAERFGAPYSGGHQAETRFKVPSE